MFIKLITLVKLQAINIVMLQIANHLIIHQILMDHHVKLFAVPNYTYKYNYKIKKQTFDIYIGYKVTV